MSRTQSIKTTRNRRCGLRGIAGAALTGLATTILVAPAASAQDGIWEINQTCAAQTGCFPGDSPGFPVTISQPGSYRLTSALAAPLNQAAIFPTSGDFRLDLGGFALTSPTCSGGSCSSSAGSGVAAGGLVRVHVFNGFVDGFGFNGIAVGDGGVVHDVWVTNVGRNGIQGGEGSSVRDSIVKGAGLHGVSIGNGAIVERVVTAQNGADGIRAEDGTTIRTVHSTYNSDDGIQAARSAHVATSFLRSNVGDGLQTGTSARVEGNIVSHNEARGIRVGNGSGVHSNVVERNDIVGIEFAGGTHSAFGANHLIGNGFLNNWSGVALDHGTNQY